MSEPNRQRQRVSNTKHHFSRCADKWMGKVFSAFVTGFVLWLCLSLFWPAPAECTNCPIGQCYNSAMCGSTCQCETQPGEGLGKCEPL